jgi:Methyltransferase FkbM domain
MWEPPMALGRRLLPRVFPENTIFWSTPTESICPLWKRCASKCLTGSIDSRPLEKKKGTLYFDDSDPLGGHLSAIPYSENYKPCAVNSIDDLVQETNLLAPYFLKLDTHGVELPILAGSTKTLKNAKVLVIEAYNFTFGSPAVPFWELCRSLFELGFRPLDVFDILYREVDNAFWQFDLLFAPADLPLFADSRFFLDKRH